MMLTKHYEAVVAGPTTNDPTRGRIIDTPRRRYPGIMERTVDWLLQRSGANRKMREQCKIERRKVNRIRGLTSIAVQRGTWYLNNRNLSTVICWMIDYADCHQAKQVVRDVLAEPWKFRAQFVTARCEELDTIKD
jgi:hypothetical protein